MKIEVHSIWKRKMVNDPYFPKQSWKVEVTEIHKDVVYHRIIEYDGEDRRDYHRNVEPMRIKKFLELYEKV